MRSYNNGLRFFAPANADNNQLFSISNTSTNTRLKTKSNEYHTFGFIGECRPYNNQNDCESNEWMCLEWDEAQRGKNDGTLKDVKVVEPKCTYQYYLKWIGATMATTEINRTCCSFIRTEKSISHLYEGRSLVDAIIWRYRSQNAENSELCLNSIMGQKIDIVFKGQKEAQAHFSNLEKLKFIEVDATIVSHGGEDLEWTDIKLKDLKTLRIVGSQMWTDWNEIYQLINRLPNIKELALPNCWRLGFMTGVLPSTPVGAQMLKIESLDLTGVPLTWSYLDSLIEFFKNVIVINLSKTGLEVAEKYPLYKLKKIYKIHFDYNNKLFNKKSTIIEGAVLS